MLRNTMEVGCSNHCYEGVRSTANSVTRDWNVKFPEKSVTL